MSAENISADILRYLLDKTVYAHLNAKHAAVVQILPMIQKDLSGTLSACLKN